MQKRAGIAGLRRLSLERSTSSIGHWLKSGNMESGVSPPSFGKSGLLCSKCLCEHWFMLRISSLLEFWHSGYVLSDWSPLKTCGCPVSLMSFSGRQQFIHVVSSYCWKDEMHLCDSIATGFLKTDAWFSLDLLPCAFLLCFFCFSGLSW